MWLNAKRQDYFYLQFFVMMLLLGFSTVNLVLIGPGYELVKGRGSTRVIVMTLVGRNPFSQFLL